MILKSFYRKKSSKIYFFVTLFIFIIIGILEFISGYLNILNDTYYIDNNLEYIQSSNDCYDLLNNNKNIINVRRILTWDYDTNNVFDSFAITNFALGNKVIVDADKSLKVNNNEVIINLDYMEYYNRKLEKEKYIGQKIIFNIDGEIQSFIIKDIINKENKNKIFISKDRFNNYLNYKEYNYTFNYINEKKSIKVKSEIESSVDSNIVNLKNKTSENVLKVSKNIKNLKIANYIIIIVFILIIIIIDINVISDNKINNLLQKKMGYKKLQRRINTYIILNFTNTVCVCLSTLVLITIDLIFFVITKSIIPINSILITFVIYFLILLCNLLLVIYTDNN